MTDSVKKEIEQKRDIEKKNKKEKVDFWCASIPLKELFFTL